MDNRELEMYKVQDVIEDRLKNEPVKKIARVRKISNNTVKKYRDEIEVFSRKFCSKNLLRTIS